MIPLVTMRDICNWVHLALSLLVAVTSASDCPNICSCKWKYKGKLTAECQHKKLNSLPEGLDPDTQVLDISHNSIQRLPGMAFKEERLINLQKIYLINCNLQEINSEAFMEISNLVTLDLSENILRHIPGPAFQHTPELRELNLNDNPIQRVEVNSFVHLSSLKELDLTNCFIKTIAARAFLPLRKLEKLRLANNSLTELQPRLVHSLQNLHLLTVHNNPWNCDCRLRKLREWLVVRVPYLSSPRCSSPPRIFGRSFSELQEDDFACPPEILPTNRNVESLAGENITVWCPVGGLPTPTVTWYEGDRLVSNGTQVGGGLARGYVLNEASEERGSLLLVMGIQAQDSGLTIECVASNPAGSAHSTFHMVVAKRFPGGLSANKIAAMSTVLLLLLGVIACVCYLFICRRRRRRYNTHTPVPIKTVSVNGAVETRIANLPYTPSAYVGGSVIATTDNPDLLYKSDLTTDDHFDEEEEMGDDLGCTTDEGSQHSLCSSTPLRLVGTRTRSRATSLEGAKTIEGVSLTCPFDAVWEPQRAQAMLDSAAPENVMHSSLHEALAPNCDAMVQKRLLSSSQHLLSSSQRHLNSQHRFSYLPDFAPDYSELYSFSQVPGGAGARYHEYSSSLSGVQVPHYGTIPRSMKARSCAPEVVIPGDGTPTMIRNPRAWHFGSEGSPLTSTRRVSSVVPPSANCSSSFYQTATASPSTQNTTTNTTTSPSPPTTPPPAPNNNPPPPPYNTCLPPQPLSGHHTNKISRITARDSPDEGYQEGADV